MTEDEMVGWHHRLDGHEFKQVLGAGNGLGSLACHSPRSHKESGLTERLNYPQLVHREDRAGTGSFWARLKCWKKILTC